ncbi:MAG: hypothetical protein RR478_03355, partial [Bacilli bacterium]
MEKELKEMEKKSLEEICSCKKEADLMNVKAKYIGKNSELASLLSKLRDMNNDDKKKYGLLLNQLKVTIT